MGHTTMQRAALMVIGLALAGCSGEGQRDKAGGPRTAGPDPAAALVDRSTTGESVPSSTPEALSPVDGSGTGSAAAPGATSAAPGGSTGTGGQSAGEPAGGGSADPGPGAQPGATGAPSRGSTGWSGSSERRVAATPEDCAALREVMAIVDHPDLHRLKAQTGC